MQKIIKSVLVIWPSWVFVRQGIIKANLMLLIILMYFLIFCYIDLKISYNQVNYNTYVKRYVFNGRR